MRTQPDLPYAPTKFRVFPVGTAKKTRRAGKVVSCWDVRGTADGKPFSRRFTAPNETAQMAKNWVNQLNNDFAAGMWWDRQRRQFVAPTCRHDDTVYEWLGSYWDDHVFEEWEPATRVWAARSFTRACAFLLRRGAPPMPAHVADQLAGRFAVNQTTDPAAVAWLAEWSLPMRDVTHVEIKALLKAHRTKANGRPVSPATERRFAANLRSAWKSAEGTGVIATNPWKAVKLAGKSKSAGKVTKGTPGVRAIDKAIVLDPTGVINFAYLIGSQHPDGGGYVAFVATMGLCGLRPSEARGVRIEGIALPDDDNSTGWLTFASSRRLVSKKWIAEEENPTDGPLKGLASNDKRHVPIPSLIVPILRHHLATYRADAGPEELAFVTARGKPINLSNFARDYWNPARAQAFGTHPALSHLTRHDLRHAACSMWLNSGVQNSVAMEWSGHRSLSVFLNVYQGVLPRAEQQGVEAMERFLAV